jgi:type IV secretion system protein VirB2
MKVLSFSHMSLALISSITVSTAADAQVVQTDPAGSGPILSALRWVEGTLLGNLATTAAVIAIAVVGLLMLTGRMDWRRGLIVVLGAFIVFGATAIVAGMRSIVFGAP